MAVLKHIKSRNANYSDVLEYLLFQHDEKSRKMLYDDLGRKLLREEYYMDGLNCEPMAFDEECKRTNAKFYKNRSYMWKSVPGYAPAREKNVSRRQSVPNCVSISVW